MALVHENVGDFVLFPRDPPYHHNMGSEDDINGLNSSYEQYPSMPAYSSAAYYNTPHYLFESAKSQDHHGFTPAGSPCPSISQALDHPPSTTLSSASGASVQSTASSAVGSPYSHATHNLPSQDQWTESHHGLGIASGVVHSNDGFGQDIPQWGGMENEMIFDSSKLQDNFVGESEKVSSSPVSPSCSAPLSMPSCSASQVFPSGFSFPSQAVAPTSSGNGRNITIDTILEEVNCTIQSSPSPTSTCATSVSPVCVPLNPGSMSSPRIARSFRSPTTPASAMSPSFPSPAYSPRSRQPGLRRPSLTSSNTSRAQRTSVSPTETYSPYVRSLPVPELQEQFPFVQSSSPFFGQSSGRFIPPLQSSCWFSFMHPLPSLCSSYLLWERLPSRVFALDVREHVLTNFSPQIHLLSSRSTLRLHVTRLGRHTLGLSMLFPIYRHRLSSLRPPPLQIRQVKGHISPGQPGSEAAQLLLTFTPQTFIHTQVR